MSFTKDAKAEILTHATEWEGETILRAHLYGMACFSKYYDANGLSLQTEIAALAKHLQTVLSALGIEANVEKRTGGYECSVRQPSEVAKLLACLRFNPKQASLRLARENIEGDDAFVAFLTGCFLAGGLITNPAKEYLMEFLTPRFNFAADFTVLLFEKGFDPKRTVRKSQHIIYFKASEQVEDLLATMGATAASFEVMNLKIIKDIRNNANRVTNCEAANIEKTITATKRYLECITYLEKGGVLQFLPMEVQQVAVLRREHPAITLAELGALCNPPVGKSGVSYRLRKIEAAAAKLREKEQNG
ncbi:DNA-binding protein WhiA [Ruminococcaceae bacterium OttesenSCG-928-N02]|nr:DNA-binding protein WhiA [Ruminococcaceae bacterium OttesenSCG-928-N02]